MHYALDKVSNPSCDYLPDLSHHTYRTTQFPHPFIGPPVETPRANALSCVPHTLVASVLLNFENSVTFYSIIYCGQQPRARLTAGVKSTCISNPRPWAMALNPRYLYCTTFPQYVTNPLLATLYLLSASNCIGCGS
jgi:hypothetical protein